MRGYAIANMSTVTVGPEIVEYLQKIDGTLAPFEGKFIVHGATPEVLEGTWAGTLIVIEFPSVEAARGWYASTAYRTILPLRLEHSVSDAILIAGVEEPHRATDVLR